MIDEIKGKLEEEKLDKALHSDKKSIIVGVHDGLFHNDDVISIAIIKNYIKDNNLNKEVEIIRSRDEAKLSKADVVVDVGRGRFDHHQPDTPIMENGIKHCGATLLADYLYKDQPDILNGMHKAMLDGIAALDNGVSYEEMAARRVSPPPVSVRMCTPAWNEEDRSMEDGFKEALALMEKAVEREIEHTKSIEQARAGIAKDLEKVRNHSVKLTKGYPVGTVCEMANEQNKKGKEEINFLIYHRKTEWQIIAVPIENTRVPIVRLPREYGGLSGKELEEATGIKGLKFCHSNGNFACGTTEESITKFIEKTIERNPEHYKQDKRDNIEFSIPLANYY